MSIIMRRGPKQLRDPSKTFKTPSDGSSTTGVMQRTDDLTKDADITRIMVVDDDPQILKLVAQMVVQLGYRSTATVDALDALFHLNKTHHDLVITDYGMPFMDGFQLADQIKRRHCMTKVIIMSGQCEAMLHDRMVGSVSVDGLLLKPFNLITMREKIEAARGFI